MGLALLWSWLPGCRPPAVTFPAEPLAQTAQRAGYDTNGDGKADFFLLFNEAGRADRIGYDLNNQGKPGRVIHLNGQSPALCRHLVIILDGMPYAVLKEYYDAGHLRLMNPPVAVIAPYPVMTDLALEDALDYIACEGYEAKYYSRCANKVVGGTLDYLAGRNEPFTQLIQYRASTFFDAFAYLTPKALFDREINQLKRVFDRHKTAEVIGYFVSSAGMGSILAKPGQIYTLQRCEQLVNQVVCESGGLVKVTMFADHGQTNVGCEAVELDKHLAGKGWRLTNSLAGDKDVVLIRYGLVTVAAINCRQPAAVAKDVLSFERVKLVSWIEGDGVVVADPQGGQATIHSVDGLKFQYKRLSGDPLKLGDLPEGLVDGREVFKATADGQHEYPDPLYRLWRAHFGIVQNTADVLVSLDDCYYNGASGFAGAVKMASTHGGLNWANGATFIMSSAGPMPGPMRSGDIPSELSKLLGKPFPRRQ